MAVSGTPSSRLSLVRKQGRLSGRRLLFDHRGGRKAVGLLLFEVLLLRRKPVVVSTDPLSFPAPQLTRGRLQAVLHVVTRLSQPCSLLVLEVQAASLTGG